MENQKTEVEELVDLLGMEIMGLQAQFDMLEVPDVELIGVQVAADGLRDTIRKLKKAIHG